MTAYAKGKGGSPSPKKVVKVTETPDKLLLTLKSTKKLKLMKH